MGKCNGCPFDDGNCSRGYKCPRPHRERQARIANEMRAEREAVNAEVLVMHARFGTNLSRNHEFAPGKVGVSGRGANNLGRSAPPSDYQYDPGNPEAGRE